MECPQCRRELQVPIRAQHNAEGYCRPVVTVTECCHKTVRLTPRIVVEVAAVPFNELKDGTDDWGILSLK
jgi:hypothetical protein